MIQAGGMGATSRICNVPPGIIRRALKGATIGIMQWKRIHECQP